MKLYKAQHSVYNIILYLAPLKIISAYRLAETGRVGFVFCCFCFVFAFVMFCVWAGGGGDGAGVGESSDVMRYMSIANV